MYERSRKTSRRTILKGLAAIPVAPNRPVLTTQLYFPGEPRNASDGIFNSDLLVVQQTSGGISEGAFNFVVQL